MSPSALVREARQSAGLTQAELAARLGVSQPVVARLERRGSNPTWDTLVRALRATGHDVELKRSPPAASLDLEQIRERLALTPAERLRVFEASHANVSRLRAAARRRDDG
jgi:transcriptional regulator with XRE-family HTH domain